MKTREISKDHVLFGNTIRRHRLSKGLSQEQLANLANLDRTYVGGVERGERNVSLANIIRLSKAIDVDIRTFFDDICI